MRKILLPPIAARKAHMRTVVLDLDDTLAVISDRQHTRLPSYRLEVLGDGAYQTHRPFLKEFLTYASDRYEVVLWTAGILEYALKAVEKIYETVGRKDVFDHVLARDPSWFEMTKTSWYKKRLEQLGRPLTHVVMLENAPVVVPMSNCLMVQDFLPSMPTGNGRSIQDVDDATLPNMKILLERWEASERNAAEFIEWEVSLGNLAGIKIPEIMTGKELRAGHVSVCPIVWAPKSVTSKL